MPGTQQVQWWHLKIMTLANPGLSWNSETVLSGCEQIVLCDAGELPSSAGFQLLAHAKCLPFFFPLGSLFAQEVLLFVLAKSRTDPA